MLISKIGEKLAANSSKRPTTPKEEGHREETI